MGSKTLTISIPEDQARFLDENPSLSPSKVFQGALQNIENTLKTNPQMISLNKEVAHLKKFIETLQEHLQKATNFIEDEGLWDKFSK